MTTYVRIRYKMLSRIDRRWSFDDLHLRDHALHVTGRKRPRMGGVSDLLYPCLSVHRDCHTNAGCWGGGYGCVGIAIGVRGGGRRMSPSRPAGALGVRVRFHYQLQKPGSDNWGRLFADACSAAAARVSLPALLEFSFLHGVYCTWFGANVQ